VVENCGLSRAPRAQARPRATGGATSGTPWRPSRAWTFRTSSRARTPSTTSTAWRPSPPSWSAACASCSGSWRGARPLPDPKPPRGCAPSRGKVARLPPRPAGGSRPPRMKERQRGLSGGGGAAQPGVAHRRRDALRLPVPHAVRVRARLRAARPGAARPRGPCACAVRSSQCTPPLTERSPAGVDTRLKGGGPGAQDELHRAFDNCELRSVVVTDAAGGGKVDTTWWPGGRTGL